MQFNAKRIPEGHSVLSQNVPVTGEKAQWLSTVGDVSCTADVDRFQTQIHLHVRYQCVVRMQCSRCLTPITQPLSGEFLLVLQEKTRSQDRRTLPEEEVDLFFDEATGDVDIAPLVFDEIVLSVPMKPLCSEQCAGIAVKNDPAIVVDLAGENPEIDPRWKALGKLRNKENR
jgi:uncharacterized metal-binding protein YceD (DUF177 family)